MADMAKAYDLAVRAVRQRLAEQHPERLEVLDEMRPGDISVYRGDFDSIEDVLTRFRIPFELDPPPSRLAQLVFVNCTSRRNSRLVKRIEPHVRDGAWLVSSDWQIDNVIAPAFPDTIQRKDTLQSGHEVIGVEPALDSLWSDVVVLGADPQWWLWGSYPIEILDAERVHIEAASHELLQRFGCPAVAVRFDWQEGHVYHVISHFWVKYTRSPNERYNNPCTEFLKLGMRLSDDGIERVLRESRVDPERMNFATIQSAATATELVVQICIEAKLRQHAGCLV